MREVEARDSLREEISQNLNENLTEHEVVTWTVIGLPLTLSTGSGQADGLQRDTVRVERVTDRTRESGSRFNVQGSKIEVRTEIVHDTVYVERTDTVEVSSSRFQVPSGSKSLNPQPSTLNLTLKWILWIIIGLIALIITVKVCLLRR